MTGHDAWQAAIRALAALAVDPDGLGGMVVRARAGPVREAFEAACSILPLARHRVAGEMPEERLFGGVDVLASLQEGRLVRHTGLVDRPGALVITGAERATVRFAAQIAALLDARRGHCLVVLDEGAEAEEATPHVLKERCAFFVDLSDVSRAEAIGVIPDRSDIIAARNLLTSVSLQPEHAEALTAAAFRLGIGSLRAPLLALRTSRALAALDRRQEVGSADIREAAQLVFADRATVLPEGGEEPPGSDFDSTGEGGEATGCTESAETLENLVLAAVAARLPGDLLQRLSHGRARAGKCGGTGAGARRRTQRRGRPLPSRPGHPGGRARVDIVATLRTAAPFQRLRVPSRSGKAKVVIQPTDLRVRRYEAHSDRLLVFVVDASGSSALARMAEAKGAVELLLAQGYAARDHVALVAFRGAAADVLLQPTRSLVQAKRQLAALPGGGGTPLASGLLAASRVMAQGEHHGLSPSFIVLTDGRGNIALDGQADRAAAREDARTVARLLARSPAPGLVIDTSARPAEDGAVLAGWMDAAYLALPRADAQRISRAADAALRN